MTEKAFIVTIEDAPDNLEAHQIQEAIEHYLSEICHVQEATPIPLGFGELLAEIIQ